MFPHLSLPSQKRWDNSVMVEKIQHRSISFSLQLFTIPVIHTQVSSYKVPNWSEIDSCYNCSELLVEKNKKQKQTVVTVVRQNWYLAKHLSAETACQKTTRFPYRIPEVKFFYTNANTLQFIFHKGLSRRLKNNQM